MQYTVSHFGPPPKMELNQWCYANLVCELVQIIINSKLRRASSVHIARNLKVIFEDDEQSCGSVQTRFCSRELDELILNA